MAEIFAVMVVDTVRLVTVKLADFSPVAATTLAETVAAVVLLLPSVKRPAEVVGSAASCASAPGLFAS